MLTCLPPLSKQSSSLSNWIGLFEVPAVKSLLVSQRLLLISSKNVKYGADGDSKKTLNSTADCNSIRLCQAYRNETATDYGSTRSHTSVMLNVDYSENVATILSLDSIRHALFNLDLLCLDLQPTILLCSHKQFKDKKIFHRTQTKDGRGGP